jgi:hypothetical protein
MGILTNKAHSFTTERWHQSVARLLHRMCSFFTASFASMIGCFRFCLFTHAHAKNVLWGSCLVALLTVSSLQASEHVKITTKEARTHVGETVTVCGKVVSTRTSKYKVTSQGRPIFLNLDEPEPSPVFVILTWPSDSALPGKAEDSYLGKQVCVTGKIVKARGVPQIITPKPSQIQVQSEETK